MPRKILMGLAFTDSLDFGDGWDSARELQPLTNVFFAEALRGGHE